MSRRPPPARPPPRPKPGQVLVYKAIYAYKANQQDELSFEEGDTIYVSEKRDDGWWRATCGGKSGLVPSNYIESGGAETIENPLHEAAKRGNLPFLEECLTNRVSVNGLDKSGSTALHWASSGGHVDCVQRLLSVHNVEVDVQNKLGDTPLHSSAWKGHGDIVEMLLDKGANKTIRNNEKQLPYDLAVKNPQVGQLLKITSAIGAEDYGDEDDSD